MEKPTYSELGKRIKEAIHKHPNEVTYAVWDGYVAALLEWGLISVSDHEKLCDLIPQHDTKAILGVFLGNSIE